MEKRWFVYIISNKKNWTLYIWVTSDLLKRIWEHKNKITDWFSSAYYLDRLVYYEAFGSIIMAIKREKQLKNWHREWKINKINEWNPDWEDLYPKLFG
ncbi:MAG: hypothetical protein ACD_2C00141G0006 [uncultured bacterium (gcode 4)]|uniref:GIY-YIG domain-containing protein n=1 Tax=uncultured bacterium (gcode 4) TaxID=1234023 RepID=K2GGN8_9BACT|nr:MAG: hypothetical protein ACD_2C00141G0006 [uncultured bacterium (gcode 4)]